MSKALHCPECNKETNFNVSSVPNKEDKSCEVYKCEICGFLEDKVLIDLEPKKENKEDD